MDTFSLLVTLFLGIITLAMLLQGVAIFGMYRRFQSLSTRIEDLTEDTKEKTKILTESVQTAMDSALPILESAQKISEQLAAISEIARTGMADIDQFREESTGAMRRQMRQFEEMLDKNTYRLDRTLDVWQNNILTPALEVGALIKGVKTGLDFFLSRRKRTRLHGIPDDDLFV